MEMPQPGEHHARLQVLATTWKGTETMHPSPWDPAGSVSEGVTRGRSALRGLAVVVDYEQIREGQVTFEGHGVYTWDAAAEEVVLHWFGSMGMGREEFRGKWDGDRLALQNQGPMGHMRLTYDFSRAGELASGMQMSPDGESWSSLMDGRYEAQPS